jgi:cleavage and polyadenylation specificity factor subunit 1
MPYLQCITALKIMPAEISENTHEQKLMVIVGSAALRGEDMPARGTVTVLDIIDVVPDPDRAESGVKFHVFSVEDTKGAITAVESFPGGLIGTAQGQKVMVRGLKDDGSCLPVAFLDAQCHATTLKTLPGRGLWLLGDAWKGLWFGGFTEEPYKITVLGKSRTDIEVMSTEFLPFDGQLFVLIIDANTDLHVLQYDPENPKTVSGMRLLHRSTFHLGHFPTSMTLLPSTLAPSAEQDAPMSNGDSHTPSPSLFHILITSQSGNLSLLTPLDESAYRRLSALQIHLSSILEHTAGLNPRAYRAAGVEAEGSFGGRGVVDGSLVRRISELGSAKRSDVLGRAGAGDLWALRSDLEIVTGGGLAYL